MEDKKCIFCGKIDPIKGFSESVIIFRNPYGKGVLKKTVTVCHPDNAQNEEYTCGEKEQFVHEG